MTGILVEHFLCVEHFRCAVSVQRAFCIQCVIDFWDNPTRQEGLPAVVQEGTEASQQIQRQSRLPNPESLRPGPGSQPPCYTAFHPQAYPDPSQFYGQ